MRRYEATRIWQSSLGAQLESDSEAASRRRLRAAFEGVRDRAVVLAQEIARDLPEFTVHDISHVDALWEMGDLVAGPDMQLNPAEAFVLGAAILVHDLGLGLAAYPDTLQSLKDHPLWADTKASLAKQRKGGIVAETTTDAEIDRSATAVVLRQLHAERAERLALASWTNGDSVFHLIEDVELRRAFGRVVGLVAHSHWWPVSDLVDRLPSPLGAVGGFANDWTVDPLKLACILRIADAIHLDDRRAPAFLRALRRPSRESIAHWVFQEKLYQPRLDADRLIFSAKAGFELRDASAWWLCYDTLRAVHDELEQVDALLADSRRPRLAARGVAYVDAPRRLVKLIPTEGWHPIDAQLRVGAVASLVTALGGKELYGRDQTVPLRELVQNGSDAVKARRLLEGYSDTWGTVRISAWGNETSGFFIEVSDTGVGMSVRVLSGPLLDFGTSFWSSSLMHTEFPGLEAKGFESTGRFGIGFFSVFMWGDDVQVRTRRFEAARDDTWVLEFAGGVGTRPILRQATPTEVLREGGTSVRVRLKDKATWDRLWKVEEGREIDPVWSVAALTPTSDVSVEVSLDGAATSTVVEANDWLTIPGEDLIRRIDLDRDRSDVGDFAHLPSEARSRQVMETLLADVGSRIAPVADESGTTIGRACIVPYNWSFGIPAGTVTVGGFRTSTLHGVVGILLGRPVTAARAEGIPLLRGRALATFATDQARLLARDCQDDALQVSAARIVVALGGDPGTLKVVRTSEGWLTREELLRWVASLSECVLASDFVLYTARHMGAEPSFPSGTLLTETSWSSILSTSRHHTEGEWLDETTISIPRRNRWLRKNSLDYLAYTAIAEAWKSDVVTLLESAIDEPRGHVATVADRPVFDRVVRLKRPLASAEAP